MSLFRPLKSLKIRLFSTFQILENCYHTRKKALTVWKFQTIKVILYSNLFFMFSQDDTFALKLDKSLCPVINCSTQTLGRRDLSGCFLVHICAFYSSYSSYFAFLCTSPKIFRAKMESRTSYEYLFAKVIGQVISNAFLIFSINCNSSSTVL